MTNGQINIQYDCTVLKVSWDTDHIYLMQLYVRILFEK